MKNISFHLDFSKIYQFYEEQKVIEEENKKKQSKSIEPVVKKLHSLHKKVNEDKVYQESYESPDKAKQSSGFHKYKNNIELLKNLKEAKINNNSHDTEGEVKNTKTSFNTFLNQTQKNINKSSSIMNHSMKKSFVEPKTNQKEHSPVPLNLVFNDCKVTFNTNIIHPTQGNILHKEEELNKSPMKEVNIKNIKSLIKSKVPISGSNIMITNSVLKPLPKDYNSRNKIPEMPTINNPKYNNPQKNSNNAIYNSSNNLNQNKENFGKRHVSVSPNVIIAKVKGINLFPTKKNVISVDNKMFKIIRDNKL
jgi:hypothetical protein